MTHFIQPFNWRQIEIATWMGQRGAWIYRRDTPPGSDEYDWEVFLRVTEGGLRPTAFDDKGFPFVLNIG